MNFLNRELRKRGLFLYQVAQQIGIHEDRIRRVLRGRSKARPGELERLAEALGLKLSEILGKDDPASSPPTPPQIRPTLRVVRLPASDLAAPIEDQIP